MNCYGRRRRFFLTIKKSVLLVCMIMLVDAIGTAAGCVLLRQNLVPYFTLLTMVESAVLFLLGGAQDLAGSLAFSKVIKRINRTKKEWRLEEHVEIHERAAIFVTSGIMLLILSFVLAYSLG